MNREQKAAVIEEVATEIRVSDAVFAVDYRGISVKQAGDLRIRLGQSGASFRVVKNTLTERAADEAGTVELKTLLEGPTALAFVRGDVALAAKALAAFRRETQLLEFKGGLMDGQTLSAEEMDSIAQLPARDVLFGQFVGVLASPLTGLVRGLSGLVAGLASQLGQIRDQGLVGGGASGASGDGAPAAESPGDPVSEAAAVEDNASDDQPADAGDEAVAADGEPEAPGDPVAEAAAAEEDDSDTEAPAEGDTPTEQEG